MNLPKANISPRSRRRAIGSSASGASRAMDDARVQVLIEVPWIGQTAPPETSSQTVEPQYETQASVVSTVSLPSLPSLPTLPTQPLVATAPVANETEFRFDAAHVAAPPAPHTANPVWTGPEPSKAKSFARRPAVWLAGIMAIMLVAFLLLRPDGKVDGKNGQPDDGASAATADGDTPVSARRAVDRDSGVAKPPLPHRVATKPNRAKRVAAPPSGQNIYSSDLPRHAANTHAALETPPAGTEEAGPSFSFPNEPSDVPQPGHQHSDGFGDDVFEFKDEPPTMPASPVAPSRNSAAKAPGNKTRVAWFSDDGITHQ